MRISLAYRLWKEGKIQATKEQMSKLWEAFEHLNPYRYEDRLIGDAYVNRQRKYFEGDEEDKEDFVNTFNLFFERDAAEPDHDHTYLLK
jgi:hypothetical protein